MLKARKFVDEVREIAKKYNLPYFIVTEGASGVNNNNCEAVEVARKNHINWEINNNLDPHHDWKKDENKLNNNIITIVEFRKYENEYGCNKDYFSSNLAHISNNRINAEKWIKDNTDFNSENEHWWWAIFETRIGSDLVDEEYIMNLTFYDKYGDKTINNEQP